ncbi:MAG: RES domain-containing protein [Limnohabitans sp.]|nr:RES domain-containing protein [Limnohabitans sp.]
MNHRRGRKAPPARNGAGPSPAPKGILELDRFSQTLIERWSELSADLDELNDVLYFHLEPQRRRLRSRLLQALGATLPRPIDLEQWVRIVDYQWSLHPLSAAGSLLGCGGRFNAGHDLEPGTLLPWPALYLAQNYSTAYREKFQLQTGQQVIGLTPEELALSAGQSHSTVVMNGKLTKVFHLNAESLEPLAQILRLIQMPKRAAQIARKLKIKASDLRMITSGKQLYDAVALQNWRILPVQFGLPSASQILAELIRAADYEAIAYSSTKDGGKCLAIFVDRLSPDSFVALTDPAPTGVVARLDQSTANQLAG